MFRRQDYIHNVSMGLTEVLRDIGVNEKIVLKRRRTLLLYNEPLMTMSLQLLNFNSSTYICGSRMEGTLTPGLQSDIDFINCENDSNVIQDLSDWEPGKKNYLMVQDDTVSPGYCLLQRLRDDVPLLYNGELRKHEFRDMAGRILLKNTYCHVDAPGLVMQGPASSEQGSYGLIDTDVVRACPCKTWPVQARHWLDKQGVGFWPSDGTKRYCSTTGCFVVGVGGKMSENEELEWRISTSLAERCLMFSLNITQIQCYVLMKMILKTFIKPQFGDTISSFMCKTVLFNCIANTHNSVWRETNLLVCLLLCLSSLCACVSDENCPHFMIPQNNLMLRRISPEIKPHILETLHDIINSGGKKLLEIECDRFGERVSLKLNGLHEPLPNSMHIQEIISGECLFYTKSLVLDRIIKRVLLFLIHECTSHDTLLRALVKYLAIIVAKSKENDRVYRKTYCILVQWFCTSLGSVLASQNIQLYNSVSQEALTWISLGLNTDVSSGKLKLASIFYSIGDIQIIDIVIRNIAENYNHSVVEPVCSCYEFYHQYPRKLFNAIAVDHDEAALQHTTAFCVYFLPCEINIVPHELKYEMFRSSEEDKAYRSRRDAWMDWAVVDSLPYLYFLQYKTYGLLGRQEDKYRSLSFLVWTIENENNLGHKETALNLLGQCMEQEDRFLDALRCYSLSLNIRRRNNVAKVHICRLLSGLINQ